METNDRKRKLGPPPGWGEDELTGFIASSHWNCWATFAHRPERVQPLIHLDANFMKLAADWKMPQFEMTVLFVYRCHSAFRTTCELAMAGQLAETFPLSRACLEYAGYALHIHRNMDLAEIWIRRHDDEATARAVRNAFSFGKVRDSINAVSSELGRVYGEIYDHTIDFGGHPNERAISANLTVTKNEEGDMYSSSYLHGDGPFLLFALETAAQVGACALHIFDKVFPERSRRVGLHATLPKLRAAS